MLKEESIKEESIDEVEVTDPEGKTLPDEEAQEFLKSLQAGVFYLPQNR